MVIKGLLKSGDHVLVSSMEHNAVMRPLTQLLDKGITFDIIPCDKMGSIQLESMDNLIRPNTVALIINHASKCMWNHPTARINWLYLQDS